MNDFKKNKRFGGNDRRPGGFGNKGGFRAGGGKEFGRPEMFEATCASCGKTCEVPFRPNGMKPVYCKDCFAANGGGDSAPAKSYDRGPRREFDRNDRGDHRDFNRDSKPAYRTERAPAFSKPEGDKGLNDLRRQVEAMNTKLDSLVSILMNKEAAPIVAPTPKKEKKEKKVTKKKAK
jgi:CxxC-x17-CxxC domain-containing protein